MRQAAVTVINLCRAPAQLRSAEGLRAPTLQRNGGGGCIPPLPQTTAPIPPQALHPLPLVHPPTAQPPTPRKLHPLSRAPPALHTPIVHPIALPHPVWVSPPQPCRCTLHHPQQQPCRGGTVLPPYSPAAGGQGDSAGPPAQPPPSKDPIATPQHIAPRTEEGRGGDFPQFYSKNKLEEEVY